MPKLFKGFRWSSWGFLIFFLYFISQLASLYFNSSFSSTNLWAQKSKSPILKNVATKKYRYQSILVTNEYQRNQKIILTNIVNKGKYFVSGKPVFFKIIQHTPISSLWMSPQTPSSISSQSLKIHSQNIRSKQEFSNLQATVHFTNLALLSDNKQLTNPYGQANFEFSLSQTGDYTFAVYFLHSRDLYAEHVNFINFKVIDTEASSKEASYSLLTPWAILLFGIILATFYFIFSLRSESKEEILENQTLSSLPETTPFLIRYFHQVIHSPFFCPAFLRSSSLYSVKKIALLLCLHLTLTVLIALAFPLLQLPIYLILLILLFLLLTQSRIALGYTIFILFFLSLDLTFAFYTPEIIATVPLLPWSMATILVTSLLFPFPPFFLSLSLFVWLSVPTSESVVLQVMLFLPIVASVIFGTLLFYHWKFQKRI